MKRMRLYIALILLVLSSNLFAQVQDYEGNSYDTIRIGYQIWLKQNLRSKYYADGTPVSQPYWAYNNDINNVKTYGYLYSLDALKRDSNETFNDVQGICPKGFYIPSSFDMIDLIINVGGYYYSLGAHWEGANFLKDSVLWNGNNNAGFSIVPAGIKLYPIGFYYLGQMSCIWCSAGYNQTTYASFDVGNNIWIERNASPTEDGYSCRCVKTLPNGINEKNNVPPKPFIIYPNPAIDIINISTNQPIQNSKIYIFNILGEMVYNDRFNNEVNVSSLQAGLYVVIVKTEDNKEYRAKFVKE
jgi:uncharacterized protein (TIGR02145 family)